MNSPLTNSSLERSSNSITYLNNKVLLDNNIDFSFDEMMTNSNFNNKFEDKNIEASSFEELERNVDYFSKSINYIPKWNFYSNHVIPEKKLMSYEAAKNCKLLSHSSNVINVQNSSSDPIKTPESDLIRPLNKNKSSIEKIDAKSSVKYKTKVIRPKSQDPTNFLILTGKDKKMPPKKRNSDIFTIYENKEFDQSNRNNKQNKSLKIIKYLKESLYNTYNSNNNLKINRDSMLSSDSSCNSKHEKCNNKEKIKSKCLKKKEYKIEINYCQLNDEKEKNINKIEYFTTIATSNKLNSSKKQINSLKDLKSKTVIIPREKLSEIKSKSSNLPSNDKVLIDIKNVSRTENLSSKSISNEFKIINGYDETDKKIEEECVEEKENMNANQNSKSDKVQSTEEIKISHKDNKSKNNQLNNEYIEQSKNSIDLNDYKQILENNLKKNEINSFDKSSQFYGNLSNFNNNNFNLGSNTMIPNQISNNYLGQGNSNFQFLNISNYYNYNPTPQFTNHYNPGVEQTTNRNFNAKSQWLSNEETFIRFNKRGWICNLCSNFNYESKFILLLR